MTPEQLKDLFRLRVADPEAPGSGDSSESLWSDEEIYHYMDEAQKLFARETNVLAGEVTLHICEGEPYIKLPAYVTKIRSARIDSENLVLGTTTMERIQTEAMEDDYGIYFRSSAWRTSTGRPAFVVTDELANVARLVPYYSELGSSSLAVDVDAGDLAITVASGDGAVFPSTAHTIRIGTYGNYELVSVTSRTGDAFVTAALVNDWPAGTPVYEVSGKELTLTVFRLPMSDLTEISTVFELTDVRHQRALLNYMAYLAYHKQDADTYDPQLATNAFARWTNELTGYIREVRRVRHPAGAVRYGGL